MFKMKPEEESRIDLGVMKVQILKRVGVAKGKRYFYYLNKLLNKKMNKNEFCKMCIRILGRANMGLHNQLISSILKNAHYAKAPPPPRMRPLPNGVVLPVSPKKICSSNDRPIEAVALENGVMNVALENGEPTHVDRIANQCGVSAEERDQRKPIEGSEKARYPLLPPFGVDGRVCRASPIASSSNSISSFDMGVLPDTVTLRKRMEQVLVAHGVEGVSMECANTMNKMLDVYLKRLVSSCLQGRHGKQVQQRTMNAVRPTNHFHNGGPSEIKQDVRRNTPISLLDFSVAMELNPQQLGPNWPLLLEKINMRLFDE